MPQTVDLGAPYGVVEFPDSYTPEQIVGEYDALEAKRTRDIRRLKLSNARLADINAGQQESRVSENIALGVDAGVAGAPLAAGHVLQAATESPWIRGATQSQIDAMLKGQEMPAREVEELKPGVGGFPVNLGLNAPTLSYIGKRLVDLGVRGQKAAQEEAEQLGGGVSGNIARSLAETATVSAETLPFAALGMGPVAIAAGLQQYGLQKEQFKQQLQQRHPDLSDDEAYRIADGPAAITGAITGGLTRVFGGTERLVNRIVAGKLKVEGVKGLLREANLAGGTELPEEYLDQLSQGFVEKAYINPEKPVSEIFNDAAMAGLTGYGLGIGTAAAIQAPLAVAGRVEEAAQESRVRRDSRERSRERIRRVIAQREGEENATQDGTIPPPPGQEARPVEEAAGGIRLRNDEESRLEAQPGTEVANATTPTTVPPPSAQVAPPQASSVATETPAVPEVVAGVAAQAATTPPPPVVPSAGIPGVQPSPQRTIVDRAIADVAGRWQNAPEIAVVDDVGQLPPEVRADAPVGVDVESTPGVTDRTGKVWLVAGNITDPAHATRVIMEEAVGHLGVESALGASFDRFMQGVATRHAASPLGQQVRAAYGNDPVTVGREIVAKLAQEPSADPTLWQRIAGAVRRWVRTVFNLDVSDNDLRVLLSRARRVVETGAAPFAPQSTARFAAPEAPPPIEGLQVSGASTQVGRIAEEIYRGREAGGQQLEGLAYQRKQFRTARAELKRLAEIAYGRFGASAQTEEPIVFPDPIEGVGVTDGQVAVDDTFSDTLAAVGVPHSADNVKAMQAEIYFEGLAKRLINLQSQIETLLTARQYYTEIGVAPAEIARIDEIRVKLETQEGLLNAAAHNNQTAGGRASEIRAAETLRPQRMAQRESLSLEPVAEFFVRQVGGYRDFVERAGAAQKLAAALRDAATDPAEIARLTAEAERWLRLPQDVRAAIKAGLPLTDEQRASAFATLAQVFDDFDSTRARMNEIVASRMPDIAKEERALMLKIADSKVASGEAKVFGSVLEPMSNISQAMVADVLASLDGESGSTGTLQSQAVTQTLRNRISAIGVFALNIGENLETNRALFEWLANPTTPPTIPVGASYGVDSQTLAMILDEVQRNPPFGSAIVSLVAASQRKLADMPVVQLGEIRQLIVDGHLPEARALAQRLLNRANARASVAEASLRESLRALDGLNIERMALENGVAMFDELAAAPDFRGVRDAVSNSPFGFTDPMTPQNNTETTFKPFGIPGGPEDSSDEGFVMGAKDDLTMKDKWFHRTDRWHVAAQKHLDAYDAVQALYLADPVNNPSPVSLGFDIPKIRGLRYAVKGYVPSSFLVLSLLSENSRWKVPRLAKSMSKLAWFRQLDLVSKMVTGATGTDLRLRLADFINHFLIARSIIQQFSDIPDKLHDAMKSHPSVQMNMENYRAIWNELAHWGRIHGSPIRIGWTLPSSGAVVTAEDMVLLKRQTHFEEQLRRRVTETNPTAGIRIQSGGREVVRAGAYVGDEGLPRWLNRGANNFISDVVNAYGTEPVLVFDAATDLSASSSHPVAAFWNLRIPLLVQHVLDVRRGDRAMRLDPAMQAVELATESDWRATGVPGIHSLEDLVNALVAHAPPMPGWNVRDRIIAGLNAELRQYRDAAKRTADERAEREQSRASKATIAFSAENEFTRPAAKLELPSAFYDYGALTPTEHLTITSRANHERVVAYATAVQRAVNELQNRLDRYEDKIAPASEAQAASSYGGSLDEMKQVLGLLRAIAADFEAAYRTGNPANTQSQWYREGFGLLTSAVLALPPVGLRNMTQGQFETVIGSLAMGLSGYRLAMQRALTTAVKTVARFATDLGLGALRSTDVGASFLTGKNIQLFGKLADQISSLILTPNYLAGAQRVHELGYDTREGFIHRLKRIWEETAETETREDMRAATVSVRGTKRRVAGLAGVPVKALRAFLDHIGVQQYDQAINASLLIHADWLQKRMEEVAITYGAERARRGLTSFDATDPRWRLQPHEFGSFNSEQKNKDTLKNFELFLELSANSEGFQLERNLWQFYQATQRGEHPNLFTPRQFDAVQRRLLAEFNASTPANRASAAAGNNVIRNLLTLQGYVSDGLLKLVNLVAGGSRDRTYLAATLGKLPTLAALALMAVLIGYMAGGLTGEWEKRLRNRMPALPTPFDRDFWTSWKRWGEGTLRLGAAQLFYIGDIILAMRGEVQGSRGFDPVGRVFPISIAQRALAAMRGVWNTAKGSGNVGDALVPLADMGRSMTPYWLEVENAFGASQGVIKQGERIIRGEAHVQNLISDSRQSFGGPSYGPNTIVRRNVGDAVSAYWKAQQAGDTAGAEAALVNARAELKKLEDFYTAKYIKAGDAESVAITKAKRDVWNDYQEINPVVSAMAGKRPTAAQYQLIRGGMSGERAGVVDGAVQAWQSGAQALFGRPGSITREDVAGARAGGGGGSIPIRAVGLGGAPLRAGFAGGTRSGSRRGIGTTRRRSAIGRGTSRRRLGPRIGRATSRRRLGTRRRRGYAIA